MRVSVLLLFVLLPMLPAPAPAGSGSGRGGRRRRSGGGGGGGWGPRLDSQPFALPWLSPSNPFASDLYQSSSQAPPSQPGSRARALGSAWRDASHLRPRGRGPELGATPLTAVSPAPNTTPVPDVDSKGAILRRQYNLSTSPLTSTVPAGTNLVLYAAPLSPLLPLQDGTNTHILATEASNYAQYRMVRATVRYRPLVPNAVGGYAISISFWPQTTTTPTSVDMNSITATDVRIVVQPGLASELVIPSERLHYRNQGWRSVETTGVPEEEATSGLVMVCVHGAPINSYTNTPYTGALGLLDFALQVEFRNLTPGNTNSRVSRYSSTARHRLKRSSDGTATITTTAATRFMKDIHLAGNNGIGELGRGIALTLFNIADTLLGGLPTELVSAAGGQLFYSRPQVAENGEPTVKLYTSVENAQLDKGITIPHDIDLGESRVVIQDYDNHHEQDRPAPSPAPSRPFNVLRSNDVLWISMTAAEYDQSVYGSSTYPVYVSSTVTLVNTGTGAIGVVSSLRWDEVTIDGKPLKQVTSGTKTAYVIPLRGKLSYWQAGTTTAGYPYNYNNVTPDELRVATDAGHRFLISTYTTSLGAGPVNISGVGAVAPVPADVLEAKVSPDPTSSHSFDDFCPTCNPLGLQGCAFQSTLAEIERLKLRVGKV
ncbi:putative viral capsid protein [Paslahepevirus balayani]|uniref:Pro-secreted protein ORF2 n=1 Tax=moose hepatitis E virus TaxID=3070745 RepID=A0AAC8LIX6_9VIRU|nr:putative viral capsid protein [Paslahepevirus balayani]AHC70112.1 putative viral capsid protein [moose hepatitis E virus]